MMGLILKLKMSQITDVAEKENQEPICRSSNNYGTGVKFMYLCSVLFTFNKYSEFLDFLVICINERVGLWRMHCEHSL